MAGNAKRRAKKAPSKKPKSSKPKFSKKQMADFVNALRESRSE